MKIGTPVSVVCCVAIAAVWLGAAPALGETTSPGPAAQPNDGASSLQEIIVTAEKREENIQQVPAAVSALGKELLQTTGMRDVAALQFQTPNFFSGNTVGVTQIAIRGVGMNLLDPTTQPGVAVYVDGVYEAHPSHGARSD